MSTKTPKITGKFRKGQSGNPAGSSHKQRQIKGFSRMTHLEVVELGTMLLQGDLQQLAAIRDEKGASVNKIWLASLIVKSIQNQDYKCWEVIMNRIIGKAREMAQIEITGKDGGPLQTEQILSPEEIKAELMRIRQRNKESGL